MAETRPVIRLQDVYKHFNGEVVLDGVSLDVQPGQTTAIIGPSGCGKTVLLKHIIGLIRPDRGRVFFEDWEITALSERKLTEVRKHMGFVFQGAALFDSMTVAQNVCFPLQEHAVGGPAERQDRAHEVLAMVGLEEMVDKFPEELSGGQKKRVALARALALGPDVILYDEPTTGLDPMRSDLISELILRLQRTLGNTAVVVTHDMAAVRKIADRVLMLYKGRFIADTTPDGLERVDDETVARFVRGKASDEEMAALNGGSARPRGAAGKDSQP